MATLTDKKIDGDWSIGGPDWVDRHDKQFNELLKKSAKVDVNGSLIGAVIALPFADGAAHYVVIKNRPLTLQHIPYCDAWHVPYYTIRGLRKADIARMICRWTLPNLA